MKLTCLACGQGNRIPEDRMRASPKCGKCGALYIRLLIYTATCTNGRIARCKAASNFSLPPQFLRCERTRREIQIHRLGSLPPFSA
ncbi:MAG: hypothetical protein WBV71_10560 [Roseobacter sp.]